MSIELAEGKVVFQYNLGTGVAIIKSKNAYNDGEWHSIEASRHRSSGALKVNIYSWIIKIL